MFYLVVTSVRSVPLTQKLSTWLQNLQQLPCESKLLPLSFSFLTLFISPFVISLYITVLLVYTCFQPCSGKLYFVLGNIARALAKFNHFSLDYPQRVSTTLFFPKQEHTCTDTEGTEKTTQEEEYRSVDDQP